MAMAPFGSPSSRVVSPTSLTGKPASSAEPRRDAFRAWRLGSDGNGKINPLQRTSARAFTGHKQPWPLRTPALWSGVFLLISGLVAMLRPVRRGGRIRAPSFVRDKGEMHAAGALVTATCRCSSALNRDELTET